MEMRIVLAMRSPHRRDLLAASDPLTAAHQHRIKVAIKRVDIAYVAVFTIGVPDDDHIPPAQMDVPGKDHNPISDAVNRIAQIGVATADAVPIFTDVAAGAESASLVVPFGFRF